MWGLDPVEIALTSAGLPTTHPEGNGNKPCTVSRSDTLPTYTAEQPPDGGRVKSKGSFLTSM